MGYYDDTPVLDLLRQRELSVGKVKICYDDYRQAMAAVGRDVPDQELYVNSGWGRGAWATSGDTGWVTTWPARQEAKVDSRPRSLPLPLGINGPGWLDLIPVNATTTTSTSTTSGETGGVDNIAGRKRERGEEQKVGEDDNKDTQRTKAESK